MHYIDGLGRQHLDDDTDESYSPKVKGLENFTDEMLHQSGINHSEFDGKRLLDCDSSPNSIHYKIISNLNKISEKRFFKPDEWINNEEDCPPFFTSTEVPSHVAARIREIRHSFIFGNWMSAIALSRSLLEHALINRKCALEKRLKSNIKFRDDEIDEWLKNWDDSKLKSNGERIWVAGKVFHELKKSMVHINECANKILHYDKKLNYKNNVVSIKEQDEDHVKPEAKQCIEEISKIINAIYGG